MKKIRNAAMTIFLLVASIITVFAFGGCASKETFKFEERGEFGYAVSAANKEISGDIIIPDTYNDKPVKIIAEHAFEDCKKIANVSIPEGVTTIGAYAFKSSSTQVVNIPVSVKSISNNSVFADSEVYRINYSGTQVQWKQISGYSSVSPSIHVICSDGEFQA